MSARIRVMFRIWQRREFCWGIEDEGFTVRGRTVRISTKLGDKNGPGQGKVIEGKAVSE